MFVAGVLICFRIKSPPAAPDFPDIDYSVFCFLLIWEECAGWEPAVWDGPGPRRQDGLQPDGEPRGGGAGHRAINAAQVTESIALRRNPASYNGAVQIFSLQIPRNQLFPLCIWT